MLYILKLSIALSVVYSFYWVLLRKLTFYNWNRWYLLAYSATCFLIPFVNIGYLLERSGWQNASAIQYIPSITDQQVTIITPAETETNWNLLYLTILIAGSLFMGLRLLIQFLSLKKLKASAVLLSDNGVRLYHVNKNISPFSTGRSIYVNCNLHNQQDLQEIIRHEFIHVKQRHSLDLYFGELLCLLNWYNPFAWMIRNAIRQNLEFMADQQVLQAGLDRKQYQYLLLKVTGINSFSIANNFNITSLKKRIAMMNKNKSARLNLLRFAFMLPILLIVLLAFRSAVALPAKSLATNRLITDTIPEVQPAPPAPPSASAAGSSSANTTKGNLQIINVNGKVTVTRADGATEKYDLTKKEEKAAFKKKYGELPTPPNPPTVKQPSSAKAAATPAVPSAPAATPEVPAAPPAPPVLAKDNITVSNQPKQVSFFSSVGNDATTAQNGKDASDDKTIRISGIIGKGNITGSSDKDKTIITANIIHVESKPSTISFTAQTSTNEIQSKEELAAFTNAITNEGLENIIKQVEERGYTMTVSDRKYENEQLKGFAISLTKGKTTTIFYARNFKRISLGCITYKNGRFSLYSDVNNATLEL